MYSVEQIRLFNGTLVRPGNLTVILGPNNGGKSQFLKDLVSKIAFPDRPSKAILEITPHFAQGFEVLLDTFQNDADTDREGRLVLDTVSPNFDSAQQIRVPASEFVRVRQNAGQAVDFVHRTLGRHLIAHLSTENRIGLINRKVNKRENIEGFQSPIEAAFEASEAATSWINQQVSLAFPPHSLVLDNQKFAELEYKLNTGQSLSPDPETRRMQIGSLLRLDDQGDGIRSFCGIIVAAKMLNRPIIAVDEPEAFLHPPQAFLMGQALGSLQKGNHQIFIATHSAEILRGLLSVTHEMTVIRLSKEAEKFKSKILDPLHLKQIAEDPILSSARVLDGLFYQGVIVTESDGDVALYRAALEQTDKSSSIHFVNSYSKHLSSKIARPYKAMEVPCALILDFDALRVPVEFERLYEQMGGTWENSRADYIAFTRQIISESDADRLERAVAGLNEIQTTLETQGTIAQQHTWLLRRLDDILSENNAATSGWRDLKRNGVTNLSASMSSRFVCLDYYCRQLGVFITPCGEREAWLTPELPFTKNKNKWTEDALKFLADNNPLQEDHRLRLFIESIRRYCLKLR